MPDSQNHGLGFYRAMVAIETDATRYYGPNPARPKLLDRAGAEQLLAQLAADLERLLPRLPSCSLIAAGALYDQTQILRPDYPVFAALESAAISRKASRFRPGLVSIAAQGGKMPVSGLQPMDDIPLGLLQLLPVVVHGPADTVSELGREMEYRFLEEGQLSAQAAAWLEGAFGVRLNHARLMTLTDLRAMLRLQLEHFGFLPLWELLDAALSGRPGPLRVESAGGQRFEWADGVVSAAFESFDYWAREGGGADQPAARHMLASGYGEWTRETRQYLTTLRAHGLDVRFHQAGSGEPLQGSWFSEGSCSRSGGSDATLTEHSFGELGTIAITVSGSGGIENYYPLVPQGLNDIHAHLRERLPEGSTVAFPGTILYDEGTRCLVADNAA